MPTGVVAVATTRDDGDDGRPARAFDCSARSKDHRRPGRCRGSRVVRRPSARWVAAGGPC